MTGRPGHINYSLRPVDIDWRKSTIQQAGNEVGRGLSWVEVDMFEVDEDDPRPQAYIWKSMDLCTLINNFIF